MKSNTTKNGVYEILGYFNGKKMVQLNYTA